MEFPDSGPVGGALRRRAGRAGQPQTAGRSGPVTGPRRHRRARGGPEHRDVAGSRARLGRQEPPSPRRALARCDRDPRIVARSGGYLIAPGPGELDLAVFTALAAEGHRLLGTDPAAAADKLRSALGLWRGPALPDLHVPELETETSLLAERRQTVLEKRFEADLALGRHAELVPELSLDAIELWEAEGLTRGLGAAFIAPGICHRARQRLAEANRCRERAVEVFHALRDHHGEGFALTGVGAGFLAQQRYAEAVPYLKRTVEIFLRHDEPWGQAVALIHAGNAYRKLGRTWKALDYPRWRCTGPSATASVRPSCCAYSPSRAHAGGRRRAGPCPLHRGIAGV